MTDRHRPAGRVFRRSTQAEPPVAVEASGSTIRDADGRAYIDAAGGAIVVNVGHGRASVAAVMAEQAGRLAFAHGSAFTTEPVETYAAEVAAVLPVDDPAIYPVSGGSEAIETALKLARAYHLARGEPERDVVIARHGSYHGNTLGALDLSGRPPLRRPYEPWLGRFRHVSAAYPYRAGETEAHAARRRRRPRRRAGRDDPGDRAGPRRGVHRRADRRGHACGGRATRRLLAGDRRGLRSARRAAHRRRGHDRVRADRPLVRARPLGVRPDLLVAAKGATGGYWPFGFVAAAGHVFETVTAPGKGFVHGFTYSHAPIGAAVASEVLRILHDESLVEASATKGDRLSALLRGALEEHPFVGDIRGRGLMVGVELVADRATRRPFPRAARVTEGVVAAARERGVLVYSGTGNANGVDGDTILLGPPFVITDAELQSVADVMTEAIDVATASVARD